MPTTSEHPEPRTMLSEISTTSTSTSVLSCSQQEQQSPFTERIAAIDLRIGLLLLGEEGRKLLTEYIANGSNSEQRIRKGHSNGCEANNHL